MRFLLLAIGFLTTLPVRLKEATMRDVGSAGMWFPIIGFFMGLTLGAVHLVLLQFFAPLLAATLTVVTWIVMTGGLHLDGLADCCDGLFISALPERRLEIMRDPRLGSFGVIGLVSIIALKIFVVGSIDFRSLRGVCDFGSLPIILALTISRWLILIVARQPQARPTGMGAEFALGITRRTIFIAAIVPLLFVIVGWVAWQVWVAIIAAHAITFFVIRFAHARIGGVTGDVIGFTVELSEIIVLLIFALKL
ncbi:MAG: adenosylcobinamide-GDP ribazoletransferase [Chloroflexi bacterium]|nr:adenosylcobinamide-GDP ribazoletransferase [Chloroflexota bacterium]